ncbi:Cytidyltransferase-like protein [Gracilaria domingensis]|nr:Cytidyltransferase-like protein [Gracilaria domingensis]
MEESLRHAVELIHQSPTRIVLIVSGGASHVSSWLLSVPGASKTVLEARIPYERTAILDTIGNELRDTVTSFASPASARAIAQAAYRRAVQLSPPGIRVCGVAATCALVSTTPKKGDHRAFVATHSAEQVAEYSLKLEKGRRKRLDEELLSSRLVLQAILDDCEPAASWTKAMQGSLQNGCGGSSGSTSTLSISHQSTMGLVRHLLVSGDHLSGPTVYEQSDCVDAVLHGEIMYAELTRGRWSRQATHAKMIMPGAFNPLHYGHRELLAVAQSMYPDETAAFEISISNPDKRALEASEVRHRLEQFRDEDVVLITNAPLFSQKAEMLPNARFVIGTDTAIRLVQPKYYGGDREMIKALIELKSKGCSFLVAGRLEQRKDRGKSDNFQTLKDLNIPFGFEDMFEEISSSSFRADISSTQIRKRSQS